MTGEINDEYKIYGGSSYTIYCDCEKNESPRIVIMHPSEDFRYYMGQCDKCHKTHLDVKQG